MKKTINIGNCFYNITQKEAVIEEAGKKSATLTYEVPEKEAFASYPAIGTESDWVEGVFLTKVTITPGEGETAAIKLQYESPEYPTIENDDEEDEEDPDEDEEDEEDKEGEIVEQSLEGAVSDEPVLTNSLCEKIPSNEIEYLKAIQDGARLWESAYLLDEKGKVVLDKDGSKVQKTLDYLINNASTEAQDVAKKLILKGIHSYRSPNGIWREKRLAKSREVNLDGLGKIATPQDAPTPQGRNWLMIGKSVSKNADGKTWTIDTVFELSAEGGWNELLYK